MQKKTKGLTQGALLVPLLFFQSLMMHKKKIHNLIQKNYYFQ